MPTAPKSTPGRRTRQRILDVTLGLYNALGEPNVWHATRGEMLPSPALPKD